MTQDEFDALPFLLARGQVGAVLSDLSEFKIMELRTGGHLRIWPASGQKLEHGESLVSDLLAWDVEKDFVPHINAPQLYVSEECTQVRWMFENFTGRAGEEGACKEWSDLLRHYAEEKPPYIKPGPLEVLAGGGY